VVEITGLPDMLALAVDCVGPMGTAALVGGAPAGTTAPIDMNRLLNGGRRVRGIAQGDSMPQVFIPKLVELYFSRTGSRTAITSRKSGTACTGFPSAGTTACSSLLATVWWPWTLRPRSANGSCGRSKT
jgi:hypothetical protein